MGCKPHLSLIGAHLVINEQPTYPTCHDNCKYFLSDHLMIPKMFLPHFPAASNYSQYSKLGLVKNEYDFQRLSSLQVRRCFFCHPYYCLNTSNTTISWNNPLGRGVVTHLVSPQIFAPTPHGKSVKRRECHPCDHEEVQQYRTKPNLCLIEGQKALQEN